MRRIMDVAKFALLPLIVLVGACSADAPNAETPEVFDLNAVIDIPSLENAEPVDLVYPHLDSANSRWFFFDSASRPFGMVNLSPDTGLGGAWGAGYRYDDTNIKAFSHIHAWQLSGGAIMPSASDADIGALRKDYSSDFSHDTETVAPGYHKLTLDRDGIIAELTATRRVGLHRYTFPEGKPRRFVLPLSGDFGPSKVDSGKLAQTGPRTLSGMIVNGATRRRPKATPVFMHIEFSTDIADFSSWNGGQIEIGTTEFEGDKGGVVVSLEAGVEPVLVKFAISYVSEDGAARNMAAEAPGWDFDQVADEARSEWNDMLSRVTVTGGETTARIRFYTDLWHALQGRRIISDADGQYSDMTGDTRRIGQLPLGSDGQPLHPHFNSDSFWGAQWSIQVLWPLAYPEYASGMASSLLQYYDDGGYVPRGPSGGNYTYVMTGASSTPFIVSMHMKGLLARDPLEAYEAVKKNHLPGGLMARAGYEHKSLNGGGLLDYIELGYAPYPVRKRNRGYHQAGAGQTYEYAYQDWTLSQFAGALGLDEDAASFSERSGNWRNLLDPETGYSRPKNIKGEWKRNFNPADYQKGHVESNAKQMTWFVPHDLAGLAEAMGGADIALERLNTAFEEASARGFTSGKAHAAETHKDNRGVPINYGNQPSMQTVHIFHKLGAPWLTQRWIRDVIDAVYTEVSPYAGYNGDEDQGLMGSLAVLMKIGLFQMTGGTEVNPSYQITGPIFDRVDLRVGPASENTFTILAEDNSNTNRYIQGAHLNGAPLATLEISHADIMAGGLLELSMGPTPNKDLK